MVWAAIPSLEGADGVAYHLRIPTRAGMALVSWGWCWEALTFSEHPAAGARYCPPSLAVPFAASLSGIRGVTSVLPTAAPQTLNLQS